MMQRKLEEMIRTWDGRDEDRDERWRLKVII